MGAKIRKTGIESVGDIPWGTHLCQFYQTKEDLLDILLPYFKAGLANNEFCLWVTSELLDERDAKKALRKVVPGLDRFLRIGQIEIVSPTEWSSKRGTFSPQALVNGWVEKLVQALANGYEGIRVTSDRGWLEKMDGRAFASCEEEVENSIGKYPMIVLCTYSLDRCDKYRASEIIDVVKNHQLALIKRRGKWELIGEPGGKQDEDELWDLEDKMHALFEAFGDGVVLIDVEGGITGLNGTAVSLYGCGDEEELIGCNLFSLVAEEDRAKVIDSMRGLFEVGHSSHAECAFSGNGGREFDAELSAALLSDRSGKPTGFIVVTKDITGRKQIEESLQETSRCYRLLAENMTDVVWTMDMSLEPTYLSPSAVRLLDYDVDDVMTHVITEVLTPASREMAMTAIAEALSRGDKGQKDFFRSQNLELEMEMKRKDGSTVWTKTAMSFICDPDGRPVEILGIVRDISELKRAEELFMILSGSSPVGIYIASGGKFRFLNPRVLKFTGYNEDELLGADCLRFIVPEDRDMVRENAAKMLRGERFSPYEYRYIAKNGTTRWAMEKITSIQYRGERAALGNFMDITERKQAEEALRESERRYRLLAENVTDVIWTMDLNLRPTYLSPSIMRLLDYSVDEAMQRMMDEALPPASREMVMKAVAKALATENMGQKGLPRAQNLELEMEMRRKDGSTVWTDTTMSFICDSHGRPFEILGIVRDITERKRAEERLQQSLQQLERAMEGIIQAITLTVETRDRYTAGHQRRVAQLACAIAKEMGLSDDQVHRIRVAGLLHDIGKICVPTEILSKPGQLNDIEFAMIKTHPQVGYDILRTIEFPWPVAEIVLQHHERADGSGYHSGLQGEEILIEARILSVADVVEAMSSHRPYRLALGIDRALEEVSQNRGVLYDADVVDACSALFAEKEFVFEMSTCLR